MPYLIPEEDDKACFIDHLCFIGKETEVLRSYLPIHRHTGSVTQWPRDQQHWHHMAVLRNAGSEAPPRTSFYPLEKHF